jgi:hypothetical protein
MPNLHATFNTVTLYKYVGGVSTQLATVDPTLANGDSFTLVVTDATKKVFYNGAELLSSADNALTSVGTWGMFFGNFNGTGGNLAQVWEVTSFTAGDPPGWWDMAYAKRKPLTLTAPSSGLASGAVVRLDLDHAALVSAGDSQADGDDIRIVYWNGGTWTEVARTLFNNNLTASAWNLTNTAIMFKTQAVIAASGSDTGYYIYYKNAVASGPPTGTLASRYFMAESLSETQTASTTYASKVQLQFTPSATTEHWVVVATWRQREVGNLGVTSYAGFGRISLNGGVRTGTNNISYRMSGDVWKTFQAFFKVTGTTALQTVSIDFRANGLTDGIDSARILAFMVPDPTNANIQYGEALAVVADTVNPTSALTTTFSPSSAGDYVWMANGFMTEGPGGSSTGGLFAVDEAAANQQNTAETYIPQNSGYVPFSHVERRTLTTASQTFTIRHQPATAPGSERTGLTQLLFRTDVFASAEQANATSITNTTSTTPVVKNTLTTASAGTAHDYIYLVVTGMDHTVQNVLLSAFGDVLVGGSQLLAEEVAIDRAGYDNQIAFAYAERTTGSRTIETRYWVETGQTLDARWSHIVALRYKEASMSQGSEETNYVSVTVRVHHTNTSGGDPQLITSASTTITSTTTDAPPGLALGSGLQQTFTAADPRLLRLQIEVTGVSSGISFVLDYDGTCALSKCSSLDTPVVTVPEFGLVFAAVAVLIPVAMGGVWRRKRLVMRSRHAHDPSAYSRRGKADRD